MFSVLPTRRLFAPAVILVTGLIAPMAASAQNVDFSTVMKYQPSQRGVDVETPAQAEYAKCRVEVERTGKTSGWAAYGTQGQVLRRFVDTDGDNTVDQWRYYKDGLEVYRDLDTNANNKPDQVRWLNTGGSRWGIDKDENKKIERWVRISAEEVTQEVINALAANDYDRLAPLLMNESDIRSLGLSKPVADAIREALGNAPKEMAEIVAKSKTVRSDTEWLRFDSGSLMPNVIPKESGKASQDLIVYENVIANVSTQGKNGFVQIGEMVQVGDVWKLTRLPRPIDQTENMVAEGGILIQPSLTAAGVPEQMDLSPEMKELIAELQKLDKERPGADATNEKMTAYNVARNRILAQLTAESTTSEEKSQWIRQQADAIAAAEQLGAYQNGDREFVSLLQQAKEIEDPDLTASVTYRQLLAQYYTQQRRQAAPEDREKIQDWWLKSLESFADDHPRSDDAAEALHQLAMTHDLSLRTKEASAWYQKLASNYPKTQQGEMAAGALRRLNIKGKRISLSGKTLAGNKVGINDYQGKVVLVVFWSTWNRYFVDDLPQLIELHKKYNRNGFEVLGVNLDAETAQAKQFVEQQKVPWRNIHEPGALQSRPAIEFGIISLPTYMLVDSKGTVFSAQITAADLKTAVPELIKRR